MHFSKLWAYEARNVLNDIHIAQCQNLKGLTYNVNKMFSFSVIPCVKDTKPVFLELWNMLIKYTKIILGKI